jgi:ribosome-binding protein aMBF1 (putative translation factor)
MNSEERTGQYVRIVYKTPGIMRQINPEKLAKLSTANSMLDEKYGAHGTPSREQFNEESLAWFYGNMLRERRKELNLTQKQLAEKLGREQSYIARVENGKADIQLSSFFRIAAVLGIQFIPTFVN